MSINFSGGFIAITGETGAGKSIIIDCINIILGVKARRGLVGNGGDRGCIVAEFDVSGNEKIKEILSNHSITADGGILTIKKLLSKEGVSRVFVCDVPSSVALISELTDYIMEVNGQFVQGFIMKPENHRVILDEYAELEPKLKILSKKYAELQKCIAHHAEMCEKLEESIAEKKKLEEMVDAFDELGLEENEEATLTEDKKDVSVGAKICSTIDSVMNGQLNSKLDGAISVAKKTLVKLSSDVSSDRIIGIIDEVNTKLEEAIDSICTARESLYSIDSEFRNAEQRLQFIEDRLYEIKVCTRKYGIMPADIDEELAKAKAKIEELDDYSSNIDAAAKQIKQSKDEYLAAANEISLIRRESALFLTEQVEGHLKDLKLEKVKFVISVEQNAELAKESGIDKICFMASTNPGTEVQPVHKIASGGELSRLMLAFKAAISTKKNISSVVFDEIDSGVSGAVAAAIGQKLLLLGRYMQVLCITHSHQVASIAKSHIKIQKKFTDDNTSVSATTLTQDERIAEVANMLSDGRVDERAISVAKDLILRATE